MYAHVEEIKPNKAKESLKSIMIWHSCPRLWQLSTKKVLCRWMEQAEIKILTYKGNCLVLSGWVYRNMLSDFRQRNLTGRQKHVRITGYSDAAKIFTQKAEQAENLGFQCILEGKTGWWDWRWPLKKNRLDCGGRLCTEG